MDAINSRTQLANTLQALLPENYKMVDSPRDFASLDPSVIGVVQLWRSQIAPASNMGSFDEQYELWVMTPKSDPDTSEDDLDLRLFEVIEALQQAKWLGWSTAERAIHAIAARQAYKFTLQIRSQAE